MARMSWGSRLLATMAAAVLVLGSASLAYGDDDDDDDRDGTEFEADLSGRNEVPPIRTPASGEASFEVDGRTLEYELSFEDAKAGDMLAVAGAHIHCAPKGVNGPVVAFLAGVLPGGIAEGEISGTLTMANIVNPACGATIAELAASMRDGQAYVNVHSGAFPGGELRGQIEADD